MALLRVDLEWWRGGDSMQVYSFNPRPTIQRPVTGQKLAEFKIPLLFGSVTQQLGKDSQTITLRGALVSPYNNFDDLDEKRIDLVDGLDVTQDGELHIISNKGQANSQHIFYNGIVTAINFDEPIRSQLQDYTITILLSNPEEQVAP
jgi:hypothetical protein